MIYQNRRPVMPCPSTRTFTLASMIGVFLLAVAPHTFAQTGPGWVSLFDGNTIGDEWNFIGTNNPTSDPQAHLVTKTSYKDFQLYVEFWASDDANSGIFIHCTDPVAISARVCYEINIFDQRPDPAYGTGAIAYFSEVDPMP